MVSVFVVKTFKRRKTRTYLLPLSEVGLSALQLPPILPKEKFRSFYLKAEIKLVKTFYHGVILRSSPLGNGAWITYYQEDSLRGLKRETRLMEKVNGKLRECKQLFMGSKKKSSYQQGFFKQMILGYGDSNK